MMNSFLRFGIVRALRHRRSFSSNDDSETQSILVSNKSRHSSQRQLRRSAKESGDKSPRSKEIVQHQRRSCIRVRQLLHHCERARQLSEERLDRRC
jgi:hypothetical protein